MCQLLCLFQISKKLFSEVYPEPSQASKMELFVKIVNRFQLLKDKFSSSMFD